MELARSSTLSTTRRRGILHVLVGVGKVVGANLRARIGRKASAATSVTGSLSSRARRRRRRLRGNGRQGDRENRGHADACKKQP